MKSPTIRSTTNHLLWLLTFAGTVGLQAAVPSTIIDAVSESGDYELIYELEIPEFNEWSGLADNIAYTVDNSASGQGFDRVAYVMELDDEWVWVSFETFTTDLAATGVPVLSVHEEAVQQKLTNMNVFSNAGRIQTGEFPEAGNIEFWGGNYAPANALDIPNADAAAFDFGDTMTGGGHGSMQVHNHAESQVLFAFNNWGSNNAGTAGGLGIGNNPDGEPDWTFSASSANYQKRNLWVLVRSGAPPNLSIPKFTGAAASISGDKIALKFDEPLSADSAQIGNFSIEGRLAITAAEVSGDSVVLTTATQTAGTTYKVTYTGVSDVEGNTLAESKTADVATPTIPTLPGTIPAAADYQLIYHATIPATAPAWSGGANYLVDESSFSPIESFDRVAYIMELDDQWVFVSFDTIAAATALSQIGVPTIAAVAGTPIQTTVANMDVFSNINDANIVTTGTGLSGGNIEFWPGNYATSNDAGIPNADDGAYDFGDGGAVAGAGYGSMQIHNHQAEQVIFAFNRWGNGGGDADIGIGNNENGEHPDYTFQQNAGNFGERNLYVLVRPGETGDLTPAPPKATNSVASVSLNRIHVQYDQPMSDSAGDPANYTIAGLSVNGATLDADRTGVILTTSAMTGGADYTVVLATAIAEQSPGTQTVAANSSVNLTAPSGDLPEFLNSVPDVSDMALVYHLPIPESGPLNPGVPYSVNESVFETQAFDRVGYALQLDGEWVFVSFDAHTSDIAMIGVPTKSVGNFQQNVSNLNVYSSVNDADRLTPGAYLEGNIEFWGWNYATANSKNVPNADSGVYDQGDTPVSEGGYGSLQVHNHELDQVLLAYNRWGDTSDTSDIGIGNNLDGQHLDYTFDQNAGNFADRNLYIFVGKGEDPNLSASSAIDSGVVQPNDGLQRVFIPVRNSGSENTLTISSVVLNQTGAAYTLVSSPESIAPGAADTIELTLDPSVVRGLNTAEIIVTSNDPSSPAYSIGLSVSVPLSADLVAWYGFDDDLLDSSGNGRHGVAVGAASADGTGLANGNALWLAPDGPAAFVSVRTIPPLQTLSISLWAQATDAPPSGIATLFSKLAGEGESPYSLAVFTGLDNTLGWLPGEAPQDLGVAVPNTALADPTHIVVVHEDANGSEPDATITRLYINGIEAAAVDNPPGFTDIEGTFQIGARLSDNGFNGLIDDVQIYNRAITPMEVTNLFQNPGSPLGVEIVDPTPTSDRLPALQSISLGANRAFQAMIPDGLTVDIEYSIDLITWKVIATDLTATLQETDGARIAAPTGFYRARQ